MKEIVKLKSSWKYYDFQYCNLYVLVVCTQVNMMFVMLLWVCIHNGQAEKFARHGGNRTRDLWDTSPMLCQLSYEIKSVRVGDISESSSFDINVF